MPALLQRDRDRDGYASSSSDDSTYASDDDPDPDDELDDFVDDINVFTALRHNYTRASDLNVTSLLSGDFSHIEVCQHEQGDQHRRNDRRDDTQLREAGKKPRLTKPKPIDYNAYRPYFLYVPVDKIRRTFQNTTQYATNVLSGPNIIQSIKSPNPAFNVWRRNEPVASDTMFADVPAIDSGATMAQFFVGRKSLVCDVFAMTTDKQFINTLEDVVRKRGAMDKLITDSARVETSKRVEDFARALLIDAWQSEPHYQHQNFAEHRWKHVKRCHNWFMNWRNVNPAAWFLCLEWVCDVMNHTSEESLGGKPPLQILTGQTLDISILLYFMFWDVVYVTRYDDSQYSGMMGSKKSSEVRGRFVGFAWNVGHALTFKVLTDDTKKVINRSRIRLAKDGENNLKLDIEAGEYPKWNYILKSKRGDDEQLPTIDLTNNPFDLTDEEHKEAVDSIKSKQQGKTGSKKVPKEWDKEDPSLEDMPELKPRSTPTVETVEEEEDEDDEDMDQPKPRSTPIVETVEEEEDEDDEDVDHEYQSPMDEVPLKEREEVVDHDQDEVPYKEHIKDKPYPDRKKADDTMDFSQEFLRTDGNTIPVQLPPEEMLERTFLMPPAEDGSRVRAKILERVKAHKDGVRDDPEHIKFRCLVNDKYEEVVAYNDIVDYIEQDEGWDGVWKFKEILDHKGPLHNKHKDYMGSRYNVLVLWETGERSWQPIKNLMLDKVTIALYAKKHGLLDTVGWQFKGIRQIAKTEKRLMRRANQAKLHSFRTKPIYMYGFLVPRNYEQAMEMDKENGNDKWAAAISLELKQVDDYETFTDMGRGYRPSADYKKIRVHLVFAVKHDGRHKARLVAGGHLTDTPIDSVYSSVVSLRGIRMLTFLAELNGLDVWATDIGNAYLESYTQEKVFIVAGPEFGDREGHTLIITKALYGLRSSGLRWYERFSDVLRDMGFFPSKAERDIWMRDKGGHYEYIAVYVDDLMIISKEPLKIAQILMDEPNNFKLKGAGPISFHLGCDFFRDSDGVLCCAPVKCIEKILDNYVRLFGKPPRPVSSPLAQGDHPEIDTSELLDIEETKIYQSLVGALQWVIQIGRFDITTAVMTLSRFRAAPRRGHLKRVMRIHGYLSKMRHAVIRIRTSEPDYSHIPKKEYDWTYTCYKGASEELPPDAPKPLGKRVKFSSFVDANLYHDIISGRSVTGILHLVNKTLIDWYSKLQSTVETATFGSEYIATKTCTEQIIDLRNTFRYLGVPVHSATMMFGDNESVVNTASVPYSKLHKRHNALAYHKTRAAIAADIVRYNHISGKTNPADVVSKHWAYVDVRETLMPILFWKGDTAVFNAKEDQKKATKDSKKGARPVAEGSETGQSTGTTQSPVTGNHTGLSQERGESG